MPHGMTAGRRVSSPRRRRWPRPGDGSSSSTSTYYLRFSLKEHRLETMCYALPLIVLRLQHECHLFLTTPWAL
ncbi:hypothetical protein DAI22_02g031550 [Oryza sativa Japonica Group]|nr:hypothetical protein DAI22_02g031550 [Oryza sativa Japonica Group]